MAKASGFAVLLSKDRMTAFLKCVEERSSFAEPVAEFQHSRNVPLVCFIISAQGYPKHFPTPTTQWRR